MTGSLARQPRRIPLTGSAFIRQLAALNDVDVPLAEGAFAERLSGWFDWTDAISLSAALDSASARTFEPVSGGLLPIRCDEREVHRVRAALTKAIVQPKTAKPAVVLYSRAVPPATGPADALDDFSPHRRRYVDWQRAMETHIAPLRHRLRSSLSDVSPALARLAGLDAVMEQVLGEREAALLATVPRWLEPYFARLCQADVERSTDWVDAFRQRLRDVALAELDLRMQPVEGLLDALRSASTPHQ